MDNQEQQNQYIQPQEIDLVDLMAVLWRRKGIVVAISILVVVAGLFLFMPKSKTSVSTMLKIGEIAKMVDGNQVLQTIMSPNESKQIIEKVYLPEAIESISQSDDALFVALSKSTIVHDDAKKDSTSSLITIDCSITEVNTESMTTVLNSVTNRLLVLQNKKYKTHQEQVQNQIIAKQLDLKILTDTRRIDAEKLDLKTDRFLNEQELEKNEDEALLKQEELKYQKMVDIAETKLGAVNRSMARANEALKRHEELILFLEERMKTLETELLGVEKNRASLFKQFGGDGSSSTLLTEAILAIDSRDSRYRSQIDALNQRLAIDLPQARLEIGFRLESIAENIVSESQNVVIAKQNLEVFRIQKKYHTKELLASSGDIDTRFDGFDASHEAARLRLEADIVTLELSLAQSTPSEIIAQSTTIPLPKGSLKLVGIGSLFAGVMLGCFVAFFIEL
ncbi:hypothetical protein H8D29_01250, partial [PVC group bacterium]|nr:hypothetical protein [PVC group bacterium]